MNKSNLIIGVLVAVSLVVGIAAYNKVPTLGSQGPQGPRGEQGIQGKAGRDGVDGVTTVITKTVSASPSPVLGALSGPDVPYSYMCNAGVCKTYGRVEMKSATTTICAIQGPNATSTLDFASVRFASTGTSTALTMSIAKSATAFATTSLLTGAITVAANGPHTSFASTTVPNAIFSPNEWLVVGIAGGTGGHALTVPNGSCNAAWNQTN